MALVLDFLSLFFKSFPVPTLKNIGESGFSPIWEIIYKLVLDAILEVIMLFHYFFYFTSSDMPVII